MNSNMDPGPSKPTCNEERMFLYILSHNETQ
jgi:hypothetical protein